MDSDSSALELHLDLSSVVIRLLQHPGVRAALREFISESRVEPELLPSPEPPCPAPPLKITPVLVRRRTRMSVRQYADDWLKARLPTLKASTSARYTDGLQRH